MAEQYAEAERNHAEAMEHADAGFAHRYLGNQEEAVAAFRRAWVLERLAAMSLIDQPLEPSRSILFRGAASLALLCGQLEDAQKLAHLGLGGEPSLRVKEALQAILADAEQRARAGATGVVDSVSEELRRLRHDAEPPEPNDITWGRAA
jgi:hypothetical protein